MTFGVPYNLSVSRPGRFLRLPCLGLLIWFQHKQGVKMKGREGEGQFLHLPLSLTLSFVNSPLAPLTFPFTNCEGSVLTLLYISPPSLKNPFSDSNCPFVCDIFCRDLTDTERSLVFLSYYTKVFDAHSCHICIIDSCRWNDFKAQGTRHSAYDSGMRSDSLRAWEKLRLNSVLNRIPSVSSFRGKAASHGCLSPSSLLSLPSNTALKTETLNYTQNHSRHL